MSRKMRFGSSRQRQRDQGGKNPETDEPHVLIEEREDVGALADSHKPEPLSNNPAELKPSHSENTGLDTMGKRKKLGSTRRHRDRQDLNELRVEAAKNTCEEISDDTALGVAQSSELHHRADSLEADRVTPGMDVLLVHGEFPPPDLKHRPELRRDDAHPSPSKSIADEGAAGDTEFEVEHRESMSTNKSTQACPEPKMSTSKNLQIESKLDFEVLAELHTIESEGAGKVIYDEFSEINQLGLNPSHLQEPTVSELLSKNQVYLIGQAMQDTDGQNGEEKHISIPVEVPGDGAHRSRHAGLGNDSEGIGGGEMDQEQCFVTLSESLNMPEVESEIKLEIIAGVSGSPACVRGPGSSYEYNITTPESLDQSDSTLLGEVTLTEDTEKLDSFFSQPFPQLSQAEDEFSYKVTETCSASTEGEVHPVDNHTQDTQLSTVQVQDPNVDFMEDYFDSAVNETTILNPDDNKDSTFAYLSEVRRAEAHQAREVAPGLYQVYGNKAKGRASEGSVEGDMALQDTGSLCGPSEGVDFTLLVSPTQKTGTVHAACASLCTPDETESESETRLTFQSESKAPFFGEVEQSEDVLLTANDSVHLSLSGLTKTSKTPGGQDASVPTSYQLGDQLSSYSNIADRQRDLTPYGETLHQFGGSVDTPLSPPLLEGHGIIEPGYTSRRRKMGSTRRAHRSRQGEENLEERGEEDATIPKTVGEGEDSIMTEATPGIERIEFRDSTEKVREEEREGEFKAWTEMIADFERDNGIEVRELQQPENKLSTEEEESDHALPQQHVSYLDDKEDPSEQERKELVELEGAEMLKGSSSEPPLMFSDSYPVMEDITSEPFGDKISSFIDLPEVHISGQSFDSNVSDANQSERMPVESFPLFSPLDSFECHGESAHPESNTTGKRRKMGSTRRNQRGRQEEHTEGREEDATIPKTVGEGEDSIITEATPSIEKIELRDSTTKAGEEEREREFEAGANMIADIERDKGFEVEELQQPENKLSTEEESDHTLPQRYVSYLDDKGDLSGLEKRELVEQEGAKDMFQDWEKEPNVEPVSVEDLSDSRNIVYNINIGQNFSTSHESMSNEPLPMLFSDTYTVTDDNSSDPFRAKISSLINLPEVHISGLSFDSNVADASQSDDGERIPAESFPSFLPPVSSECHGESAHPESNTTGKRRKMGSTRRNQRGRRGDKSNSENQEDEMTEPNNSPSAVPKEEVTEPNGDTSAAQDEEVTDPDAGPSATQKVKKKEGYNATIEMTCHNILNQSLKQEQANRESVDMYETGDSAGPLQNTENVVQEANMDPDTQGRTRKMGSTRRRGEQTREERQEEEEDTGVADEMKPRGGEEIMAESKSAIDKTELKMMKTEFKLLGLLTENVSEEGKDREQMSNSPISFDDTVSSPTSSDTLSTIHTGKPGERDIAQLFELQHTADTANQSETNFQPNLSKSSSPQCLEHQQNTEPKATGLSRKMGSTCRTQGLTGEGAWQETQEGKNKGHIEGAEKEELAKFNTSMELTGDKVGPVQSKRKRMGSSRRHGQGPLGKDNLGKDGNEPDLSSIGEEHSAEVLHLEKKTEAGGTDEESTHIEVVTSDCKGDKRLLHNAPGLREGLGHTGSAGLPEQLEATPEASVGNTRRPAGQVEKSMVTKEKRQLQGSPRNRGSGEVTYNVMMVGNTHVGKTSFIKRFESGEFYLDVCASVGIDTCKQSLLVDGKPVTLQLWDTAGQERYRSITRQVFHRAQGILLMYDITSSQSFCDVRYWLSCIQEGAPEDVIIMLLGNKSECAKREVESQEGESLAKEYNFLFMECSAATGDNVLKSLETVVRMMRQKAENSGTGSTVLHKEPPVKKSSCC